jgi:hypothetical protein
MSTSLEFMKPHRYPPHTTATGIFKKDASSKFTPNSQDASQIELQISSGFVFSVSSPSLPDFDRGSNTATACMTGLAFAWLAIVSCLIASILIIKNSAGQFFGKISRQVPLSTADAEATALVLNIFVAVLTDSMGYIHATSLRWALYREDRLHFNTNIRLFNSSRMSAPNRWPANAVYIISLVLCYAATSQMFITSDPAYQTHIYINGFAISALGLGLAGQAVISTWCLCLGSRSTLSWSPNPLNNTLVLLHEGLQLRAQRCMLSVHQVSLPSEPMNRQNVRRMHCARIGQSCSSLSSCGYWQFWHLSGRL